MADTLDEDEVAVLNDRLQDARVALSDAYRRRDALAEEASLPSVTLRRSSRRSF